MSRVGWGGEVVGEGVTKGTQQHVAIPSDLVLSLSLGEGGLLVGQLCIAAALAQLALHCLKLEGHRLHF